MYRTLTCTIIQCQDGIHKICDGISSLVYDCVADEIVTHWCSDIIYVRSGNEWDRINLTKNTRMHIPKYRDHNVYLSIFYVVFWKDCTIRMESDSVPEKAFTLDSPVVRVIDSRIITASNKVLNFQLEELEGYSGESWSNQIVKTNNPHILLEDGDVMLVGRPPKYGKLGQVQDIVSGVCNYTFFIHVDGIYYSSYKLPITLLKNIHGITCWSSFQHALVVSHGTKITRISGPDNIREFELGYKVVSLSASSNEYQSFYAVTEKSTVHELTFEEDINSLTDKHRKRNFVNGLDDYHLTYFDEHPIIARRVSVKSARKTTH